MVSIILLFAILLAPGLSQATTYYVSTSGNNSNDGLTESTPKRTVAHCVSIMVAGDTCYVRGGTYNEGSIQFSKTGTQANPIKLLNYPGESPVIDFQDKSTARRLVILHANGIPNAMGYITIEGFEIKNSWDGIKFYNLHNSEIRRNWLHDNKHQGILGQGGHHVVFDRNIANHNGVFPECAAGTESCTLDHGFYLAGDSYVITNNLLYDNLAFGLQQNGATSSYSATKHPGPEFAGAANWIVANNTFAYNNWASGMVIYGGLCDNARIENNIFYENRQQQGGPNGIAWVSATNTTGVLIRNNHAYGTRSGGTSFMSSTPVAGVNYTESNNIVNVSPPAFVSGGSTLPASPDFRLTASAPVNIARVNEFPNNSTLVVGAFKTIPAPTAVITANIATLTFPMSTAVPVSNLSTAGVSLNCPVEVCPGSPAVSTVAKRTGTDTQVDVTISGITSNACLDDPEPATISYDADDGSWTGNDNIGPYPGLSQKIFSFTNLTLDNQCTGSGTPSEPGTPLIKYLFDEGTGTDVVNSGSSGATDDTTLENGTTWADGGGVQLTQQSTQHVPIPYGSGFNPTTTNLTVAFTVVVTPGQESLSRSYFGAPLGTNQRLHIATRSGAWGLGVQTSSLSGASNLTVDTGSQHLCMTVNATTDTVTLHKNGQAGSSPHAVKTASSSYTLAGDFDLGRIADLSADGGGGIFRDLVLYESVEDCAEIYAATQVTPPAQTGTLAQPAYQVQAVYLSEVGGTPTNLGALSTAKDVVKGGGAAIVAKVHCTDVADCTETAFRWAYRRDGAGDWQAIPNTENSDQVWHWGPSTDNFLNDGEIAASIVPADTCEVTAGVTLLTADQIPSVDLPQDGCIMFRGIFRLGGTASGYYEFRLEKQGGEAFTGSYENARLNVIAPQASGGF